MDIVVALVILVVVSIVGIDVSAVIHVANVEESDVLGICIDHVVAAVDAAADIFTGWLLLPSAFELAPPSPIADDEDMGNIGNRELGML